MIQLNKIYNETNIETLKRMEDNTIDLTLTSPPFGHQRSYEGFSWDPDVLASLLYEKTAEGGVCVWVIGNPTVKGSETGEAFEQALIFQDAGWRINDTIIFAKNNPLPGDCGPRYRQTFDFMFIFSKGRPKTFNPIMEPTKNAGKTYKSLRVTEDGRGATEEGLRITKTERKKGNIFYYNVGSASSKDKIAFEHPAIFPEKLAEDMISSWTNEGDLVFDPFSGASTSGIASYQLKRNFILSEISPKYCELSQRRFNTRFGFKLDVY